jgi:hypothetical protein
VINKRGVGKMQENLIKDKKNQLLEENLGFILWKVQTIEDFLPCYKTIMKKE